MTAQEALALWDSGGIVQSVDLGGIGPGYEQTIQILIFEVIRAKGDHEAAVKRATPGVGGFSGAQVGAARQAATFAIEKGWDALIDEVGPDRTILVSRAFPRPPDVEAGAAVSP